MKLDIAKPETKEGPTIFLKLVKEAGRVALMAIEPGGEEWYLLTFYDNGQTISHGPLPKRLGFNLTGSDTLDIEFDA